MNRGIARRTMFERRADMRAFLAGIACRVRAGEMEVHAFCLMNTHYHLLVRSPLGRLAEAMQRIQLGYSRYFNRGRRRDGPLVRGRFRSKPVRSGTYRHRLVSYIDSNPVQARLVASADEYPFGSAYHYSSTYRLSGGRGRGPVWLEREWVENSVQAAGGVTEYDPRDYARVFGGRISAAANRVMVSRFACRSQTDPLDNLVRLTPAGVSDWMCRQAQLADGTRAGMPVCDEADVDASVSRAARREAWPMGSATHREGWDVVRVALWIELCGSTQTAAATRLKCSDTTVGKLLRLHRELVRADARYARRLGRLGRDALRIWVGG